jgi:acetolactate synthase-1/2/3 large subunit
MIVARQVGGMLAGLGIRRVYGLPGEDHMALLHELDAAGLGYCTAFNESSAVLMAAADAHFTGLPGVVVLSLAPGVSNGVNGLLNAYMDEVPLLVISGQHPAPRLPFVMRQGFDIEHLVEPMTVWRARLTGDMNIPGVIGRAIDEALAGRPGPVYLELPDAVATAESTASDESAAATVQQLRSRWVDATPAPPSVAEPAVSALAERLAAARKPVLVLGGKRRRVGRATLAEFAAARHVPVFTSSRQKGLLDGSCEWFAGTFLNGRLEKDLLADADLVVLVDAEAFDFYNKAWNFDCDSVAIVADSFTEWANPVTDRIVADSEALLRAVLDTDSAVSQWQPSDVAAYRAGLRSRLLDPEVGDSAGMSVAAAVQAALSAWPTDGYLVADAGFGKPLVAMLSEPSAPDHYLASNALSTMGFTIPTVVAAHRAGAENVLAFLGDGSLLMRATELMAGGGGTDGSGTAVVAIIDGSLTQIEVKQERRKLSPVGAHLPPLSCSKLGDAFGLPGVDVETPDQVSEAVAKALAGPGITLIGAHVDPTPSRILFDLLRG